MVSRALLPLHHILVEGLASSMNAFFTHSQTSFAPPGNRLQPLSQKLPVAEKVFVKSQEENNPDTGEERFVATMHLPFAQKTHDSLCKMFQCQLTLC